MKKKLRNINNIDNINNNNNNHNHNININNNINHNINNNIIRVWMKKTNTACATAVLKLQSQNGDRTLNEFPVILVDPKTV